MNQQGLAVTAQMGPRKLQMLSQWLLMCHLNCVDGHFSHDHGVTQGTWAGGGAYFKRHRLVHIDDLQQAT